MRKKTNIFSLSIRLFKLASSVKKLLIISTAASVITNVAQMSLMGFGVLTILSKSQYFPNGNTTLFAALSFISIILIIAGRYIEGYVSHAGAYKLLANMRVHMFDKIRNLAPACMTDDKKGTVLSIAVNDIEYIEFFFAHTIGPIITVILLPCICLILASSVNILFALVLLPIYLIISLILPITSLKLGRNAGLRYRKRMGEYQNLVLESIYGLVDIQAFGHSEERRKLLHEKELEINHSNHELTLHRQLVTSLPTFFIYLARISIIAVASYLTLTSQVNTLGVIVLSYVVSASFSSSQSLTMVISSLLETYAAAERVFEIEDRKATVTEIENPINLQSVDEINFENINFKYNENDKYILNNFNLNIKKGEKIGIMGSSGIGKSTILRLLLRFWDPSVGKITINGISSKNYSFKSLRGKIASLEQDTLIFNDTIAGNIAFGKPQASLDEIKKAAQRAGIHDFIMTLPEQYETQMGEMSRQLSGGEKQRIGIARIMIIDPDVIVMDEPTSSLDILNEKKFLKTLSDEYADKTIIIVSHRISTLSNCDRIIKL